MPDFRIQRPTDRHSASSLSSAITHNKYNEHFAYTPNLPLHESVNFVQYQKHVDRLQQMANRRQLRQKYEIRLTKDWWIRIVIPGKYQGRIDNLF